MRTYIGSAFVALALFFITGVVTPPAQAAGLTQPQIQAILSVLSSFGADASVMHNVQAALGGNTTPASVSTSANISGKQNLSISSIELSLPAGIGSGQNISVAQQKVTVVVKNNQYGSYQLSGSKFNYAIYLYDVTGSRNKKLIRAAAGEALVPYANGYSEFSAYIEGGMPFDGSHYDKQYQAEVIIDTEDSVIESDEKDNKARSAKWKVDYYKG